MDGVGNIFYGWFLCHMNIIRYLMNMYEANADIGRMKIHDVIIS